MKKIALTTKEELNIYMSPIRQQLLRQLRLSNISMTPKMLSDQLGISASSIQHHIKKLISLGLIELDYTEVINGITARFYKPTQVTVQIGLNQMDSLSEQKDALVQESISNVYTGFRKNMEKYIDFHNEKDSDYLKKWGDVLTGVVHLNQQESDKLIKMITAFIEQHSSPLKNSSPWEYALILYNAKERSNE